jgi:hypothetical protein
VYVNDLSFDPRHVWFDVPGLAGAKWTVELFTAQDVWGLDPAETSFDGRALNARGLRGLGGQRLGAGQVTVHLTVADGATQFHIGADHADQIKGVKLLLRGVARDLLDAGWWTMTTPAGQAMHPGEEPVLLTYPWENWQTPWACAGEGPGLVIGVRAKEVAPVRLYHYHPHWSPDPVVEIVCDQLATRRSTHFDAPTIRMRRAGTREEIRTEVRGHLDWLESTHGLVEWDQRTDVPPWAKDIDLVLTLHGQHWTGYVFNTFDRMAEILEEVTKDIAGQRILAYLPGWEGRYYWQYPRYAPGEDLGGEEGFGRLMQTARRLGVHLMPMFGANGAHVARYPDWERAVLRSPSNNYVALINAPDWDNDRAGEDDQVFLNPAEPGFRNHLIDQISAMVQRFGIEGAFLDTSACWLNDSRYEMFDGYVRLAGELRSRHPDLLVCGEGWYDALLALFPMNQTWLEMSVPPRFDDLPMRYTRVLGHLKDGAPGAGSTGVHEGGTRALGRPLRVPGFIPALSIVDDTMTAHREAVRRFCRAVGGDVSE